MPLSTLNLVNHSRLIILFDAPGDWDKVLTAAATAPATPGFTGAATATASSNGADVAVEADVTMGIESEQADMTGAASYGHRFVNTHPPHRHRSNMQY